MGMGVGAPVVSVVASGDYNGQTLLWEIDVLSHVCNV